VEAKIACERGHLVAPRTKLCPTCGSDVEQYGMTAEDLAAYEEKIRGRARQSAVRAITLGPLVAGIVVLAVLALSVGSVLAFLGSDNGEGSAGACTASTACKLASIDVGTKLDPDSSTVQEYQAVLHDLGVKCTNLSGATRRRGC